MIKTIIIDDDNQNLNFLKALIDKYCPLIDIVAVAYSVQEAIAEIMLHNPDLLFLDIEIQERNGFEILKAINNPKMYVIVVSAYEKYALSAIKHQAVDYLLKPVQIEELVMAYQRYLETGMKGRYLEEEVKPSPLYLPVQNGNQIDLIPFTEIEFLEGQGRCTEIHSINGTKCTCTKNLSDLQKSLPKGQFIRVHRTFIININRIKRMLRTRGGGLVMQNGTIIPIGNEKRKEISELLNL